MILHTGTIIIYQHDVNDKIIIMSVCTERFSLESFVDTPSFADAEAVSISKLQWLSGRLQSECR